MTRHQHGCNRFAAISDIVPSQVCQDLNHKLIKFFNEVDLKQVVSEIIIAPERTKYDNQSQQGYVSVIQKLREKLEKATKELFPFFEGCTRNSMNFQKILISIFYLLNLLYK